MQGLTYLRDDSHRLNHAIGHIERMRAHEAYAFNAIDCRYGFQQIGKIRITAFRTVAVIRVHGLSQQSDFARALTNAIADFRKDLFHRMVTLSPSNVRNDAVRAGVVTAAHDRDEGGNFVANSGDGVFEV